ncbi:MAG TPA: glycosyltransferase [Marinagarivorans sp.]
MDQVQVFLSVVIASRNRSGSIEQELNDLSELLKTSVSDYEVVIVDNASSDDTLAKLKQLTDEEGLPNLQVYALTKEVEPDVAFWAGLESSLGDYCCMINLDTDSPQIIPTLLKKAMHGHDVVFGQNDSLNKQSLIYRSAERLFDHLFYKFNGVHLTKEAPQLRVLSKNVVNFLLQHAQPAQAYRHLPATAGFTKAKINYNHKTDKTASKSLLSSIDRGMGLLTSTTRSPMRIVTTLTLFGAGANLVYSIYIVLIGIFKDNVAAGWVSLSLQQSGMFFLLSLVLMVLGEYIINMVNRNSNGPAFYIAQEFTSAKMTRLEKLNLEEDPAKDQVVN